MGGVLVPAGEGGYFAAAMQQQWRQLAELQATLDATTGLVGLQAAQLARLQQQVEAQEDAGDGVGSGGGAQQLAQAQSPAACSPPAAGGVRPHARPKTAEGLARPHSASPSSRPPERAATAMRSPSPAGSLTDRRPTSSHHGMMASMKSDLEMWRAK